MSEAEIKEAARLERNAYYRAWRAKNKDKVKENNRKYWEKKAAQKAASAAAASSGG